jgi:pantoate--beta-alanine ligase
MNIVKTKSDLQKTVQGWKKSGKKIAFIPTMGALHTGHLSLVDLAKAHADKLVVSIFVNPAQFAPGEDLETYPRTLKADKQALDNKNVDLVYVPSEQEIYPNDTLTPFKAGRAAHGLETDYRPHFFAGVVHVVTRLFDHVQPDVAIFGEKDYQQLCVIKEMIQTYNMPVEIVAGPIIRDEHGLALSSRNQYLTDKELKIARTLNQVLKTAKADLAAHKPFNGKTYINMLLKNGFDSVDYFALRDPKNLSNAPRPNAKARLLVAAWIDTTRLIDNMDAFYAP